MLVIKLQQKRTKDKGKKKYQQKPLSGKERERIWYSWEGRGIIVLIW